MKKIYFFAISFCFLFNSLFAQTDTINIDLGNPGNVSAGTWNNLTDHDNGSINDLLNSTGLTTGISVVVTDSFNGDNTAGANAAASLGIPNSASNDSFFGSAVPAVEGHQVTGGVTFSGLDTAKAYNFSLFASRTATDNRETKYYVDGENLDSVSLNVSSNTANVVSVNNVNPKPDGTIVVTATTGDNNTNGSGYYYMGVIRVVYIGSGVVGPKELSLTYPNGGELWEESATPHISWNSTNVLNLDIEYSSDSGATWNTIVSGASAISGEYDWNVPNDLTQNALVRITDASDTSINDMSDSVFSIVANDPDQHNIVVLGSSTAAGTGPSRIDSAWVWKYREYITQRDTRFSVINLAVGGFTTYNILPTGTTIPSGVNQTVRVNNNVTKAMAWAPDAVIINLPSNDATNGYPVADQLGNYDLITNFAQQNGASVWVTTPQPRNLSDPAKIQIQEDMRDSTFSIFGNFAIDFWTGFATANSTLKPEFDSGDGIHCNDSAHQIFFERVIGRDIYSYSLNNPNPNTGLNNRKLEEKKIKIYPNPVINQFTIEWDFGNRVKENIENVKLVSINGNIALSQSKDELNIIENSKAIINTGKLNPGFYLLLIETNNDIVTTSVVIK